MKKSGFRATRPFGPMVPDVTSMSWVQRKTEEISDHEEEEPTLKRKAASATSKFRPVDEIIQDGPVPDWANVDSEDSFQYTGLFCQACGSFLDLRQKGRDVACNTCHHITECKPGLILMQSHAVVKYSAQKLWMEKLARSKAKASAGAQRAEVAEECPKCKNPRMFFWTQQLRSADEGQTVFYECGKCTHRYSVNT